VTTATSTDFVSAEVFFFGKIVLRGKIRKIYLIRADM
jgi:hypothetical protein